MKIAIIGGSGLSKLEGLQGLEPVAVQTPFGTPSAPVQTAQMGENTLLFLPRHGAGHTLLPSEINYRANIYALKKLGAEAVLSVSAVGSLRKEIEPGHFVLPDQYLDLTRLRSNTFFGGGFVAHANFANPTSAPLREHIAHSMETLQIPFHRGGTYVCMEGPAFSTRAESDWYRSWPVNVKVIGMTAMPEAKLAREAQLPYQTVAMATDYDCWNDDGEVVSVEAVMAIVKSNVENTRRWIAAALSGPFPDCRLQPHELTKNAVMTPRELWPKDQLDKINVLLGL